MNYKWVRDFALKLIGQYSVSGEKIAETYNNQADYINKIPELVEDGQLYVATTAARIRALAPLKSLESSKMGAWTLYHLPEDCWQVCSGGLVRCDGPILQRYHKYHLIGDRGIAVPGELDGEIYLEYYRYPLPIGPDPDEKVKLDNTIPAQMTLPYYVAAHLVMQDNAFAYSALYNEFEARLARLGEGLHAELSVVEDSYSAAEAAYNE